MEAIDIKVPLRSDADRNDTIRFLAAKLYEAGRLTLGQAASMTGMETFDFAEVLLHFGVSFINYPASDIASDVLNA